MPALLDFNSYLETLLESEYTLREAMAVCKAHTVIFFSFCLFLT